MITPSFMIKDLILRVPPTVETHPPYHCVRGRGWLGEGFESGPLLWVET